MQSISKENLRNIIQNLNKSRILVIGDFALDEMIYGIGHRVSREAPVLVLKHSGTKNLLGAAANAANNISALNGGNVSAIGVTGNDYHGNILNDTLKSAGVDISHMITDPERVTTTKTRISGASAQSVTQQIVRIDRETRELLSPETENKILEKIVRLIPDYDGVLLSDYGIGVMTQKIIDTSTETAKKHNKFIAVDAQEKLYRFKGATILTPNQPDAEKMLGFLIKDEDSLLRAGLFLLGGTDSEMILLTRGGEGMTLFEKNGKITDIPAFNKTEVFDVTGAGDTVSAAVILALCAGGNAVESAILGNLAASITVRHFGAAITSPEELTENLESVDLSAIRESQNMFSF